MEYLKQDEFFESGSHTETRLMYWLTEYSMVLMRVSLGLVFLIFGVLKFIPEASPAEDLSVRTLDTMTFGLLQGDLARVLIAMVETLVGILLLTRLFLKAGVMLLGFALIGILAPLVLFLGELFPGPDHYPTLEAQYVLKDVVLGAAGLVVALRARGAKMFVNEGDEMPG